ncbi:cytochrome P450 [Fomitiporia mediterranea MF3/22]|uniref:cytochrome P450 n=1 Tax=Fomitiporia mediterranea (strain MF3/22) TaxID=694068 RepID=UPI0004409409|nr:cytochrome P450 [Fomitiporia mediterranea MF3/22]EJD04870.1 cytochrome P450 [Fomitiporia mediterranea MF3/22]
MHLPLNLDIRMANTYVYALSALVACVAIAEMRKRWNSSRLPLPPSPPSEPIIGNIRVMPTEFQWKIFADWGKKLGDVVYLSIIGKPLIILNSAEAARDLLDKRASNFSDRPRFVLHGELFGTEMLMPFITYGERFRAQRRLMQQHFNSQAISSFRPLQSAQLSIYLKNLLMSPENFTNHTYRFTAGTLVMATYGHEVNSEDDIIARLAVDSAIRFIEGGTPGATLVDFIPILRYIPTWFPGASFRRKAVDTYKAHVDARDIPYNEVKERMSSGTAIPSLMSRMIDTYETKYPGDKDFEVNIKHVAGVIYGAGVETSEIVLRTFLLMMTCHPEVVARAHAEIDEVIGSSRLPTHDDRPNLPYIECILKEVYRTNPPLPLGLAHQSIAEDVHRQRRIPAGSMLIPNIWKMMRDERHFPDPESFKPERFLSKVKDALEMQHGAGKVAVGLNSTSIDDPSSLVFGFGRRACPGRYFADSSAWLAMANILAAFDIRPPIDPATGEEQVPIVEFTPGFASKPREFKFDLRPRNAKYVALINENAAAMH